MTAESIKKSVKVPDLAAPERLDKYLASLPELDLSRAFIQQIIVEGLLSVNGRVVAKNHRLRGGELIELTIPPPEMPDLTPEDIPLEIVYDDQYLAVVNKPAGLVTHPAPGNPRHTLVNALLHHFGQLARDTEQYRPGIIHRLDKNTSGLLIIAKNDSAARKLRQQLSERRMTKIYQAVICGHMPEDSGTIDLPIGRSIKDRKKMIVTNVKSREAITRYKVIERFRLNDLVEINLVTGRTHQIRVHLLHLHRPVLGDPDYGGRHKWLKGIDPSERRRAQTLLDAIDRQALHARSLSFQHPVTEKEVSVSGDFPDDMARLLELLRNENR